MPKYKLKTRRENGEKIYVLYLGRKVISENKNQTYMEWLYETNKKNNPLGESNKDLEGKVSPI